MTFIARIEGAGSMVERAALRRVLLTVGLTAWALFLLDITLIHFRQSGAAAPNFVPLRSIADDWRHGGRPFVVNFVGNIVAFVPFGLAAPIVWPRRARWWTVALGCLAFSVFIEYGQYLGGHRVADVDDLLLNTLGGVVGWGLAAAWRRWR